MSIRPKLSNIVSSQLPEFIREDYPTFVAFLEAYYEWLQQQDADLYTLRDIDTTLDRFIEYFRNELAPHAINPPDEYGRPRHDLAHIKDQHLAKGSEASFKFLFRLLFNKNVSVQYPGQQILRASDGKWTQDVSVFARINAGSPNDIVGRLVEVVTPNRVIRVLVDRRQDVEIEVDRAVQISPDTYEFYIDRRFFGDISIGDRMRYAGIFDATIVSTTSKIHIQQKGKDFKVGQLYTIKNGKGSGSVLKVKSIDADGGIVSAEFVKYGIGYETNFTATILAQAGQATTGTGQTALNVQTISSGVTSIIINSGGSGYTTTPTVALSGGGYTNAATIGTVHIVGGVITQIDVATPGNGYTTTPSVIITGGGGTGASASSSIGHVNNYSIFEVTEGFSEQGIINKFDYAQDTPIQWLPTTAYTVGTQIYYGANVYTVTTAGTTSSIPPSHTTGVSANGTTSLTYSREYGAAFDGTYAGDVLREFFYDSKEAVVDAAAPAIISIELGPLTKYPGYYKNNDGFLDDAIFIQDSRYYQAFSYVLKIDEKLEAYRSAVKTLVHPAGLALFGEYDIRNEFDIGISLESMVKILVINAQDEIFLTDGQGDLLNRTLPYFDITKLLNSAQVSHKLNDNVTNDSDLVYPTEYVNSYFGGGTRTGIDQYTLNKLLNSNSATPHYLLDGVTLDDDNFSLTEITSTYSDSSTRLGANIFDVSKTLNSTLYVHNLYDNVTADTDTFTLSESSTTYVDGSTRTGAEKFETVKLLDSNSVTPHVLNDGVTVDSDSVIMSDTTGVNGTRTVPFMDWTKLLNSQSATPHYLNDGTTLDADTFSLTEEVVSYVDGSTRTGVNSIATAKYMNSENGGSGAHYLNDGTTLDVDKIATPTDSGGYIHLNTYVDYPDQYWTVTYSEGTSAFAGTN